MKGREPSNIAEEVTQFAINYLDMRRVRAANYPNTDAELGRAIQYVYDPARNFPKLRDLEILVNREQALFMPALDAMVDNPKLCGSLTNNSNHAVAALSICLPFMSNLAKEMSQIAHHIKQMPDDKFTDSFGMVKSDFTGAELDKNQIADVVARMYGFGIVLQLNALVIAHVKNEESRNMITKQLSSLLNQTTQNDEIWKNKLPSCTNDTEANAAIKLAEEILAALRVHVPGKANKIIGAAIGQDVPPKFGPLELMKLKKLFTQTQKETAKLIAQPQQVLASTSLPVTKQERDKVDARQKMLAPELRAIAEKEKQKNSRLNRASEMVTDINLKDPRALKEEIAAIKEAVANGVKNEDQLAALRDIAQNIDLGALLEVESEHDNNQEASLRLLPEDAEKFLQMMEDYAASSELDETKAAQDAADELRALPITDEEKADAAAARLREMRFSNRLFKSDSQSLSQNDSQEKPKKTR